MLLTPLVLFGSAVAGYFLCRSQFGADATVTNLLRVGVVAAICVPLTMIAAKVIIDPVGTDAGKSIIFSSFFAALLSGVFGLPGFRTALTKNVGASQKFAASHEKKGPPGPGPAP